MQTIATFDFPHQAHVARASLEAAGIPAFVADEHTINMYWLYCQAMGGVRLQVPEAAMADARELLAEDFSEHLLEEVSEEPFRCPHCDSTNVQWHVRGKVMAYLVFFLMHFPLWPFQRKVACQDCGTVSPYKHS